MPRKRLIHKEKALAMIHQELLTGPKRAREICSKWQMSQPVFSRLIRASDQPILVAGKARQTLYALKRSIPPFGSEIPLYQIDENGRAKEFGQLVAIHPKGFFFESKFEKRFYEDLPYFLNDLCPSGFLGRLVPKYHPELNFPPDITRWTAEMCLQYIGEFGFDLVGNLIVGEAAFERYLKKFAAPVVAVRTQDRISAYTKRAMDLLRFGDPGSSAGGEQAKFLTTIGPPPRQVLVKFSPPIDERVGRRRADLLICEHWAHQVLLKFSMTAAQSEILIGNNRVFLQVERFDRVLPAGRLAILSLFSVAAEWSDLSKNWLQMAKDLFEQDRIDQKTYKDIRFLFLFGQLIANTDMHAGNLSFYMKALEIEKLAPAYDMLPMLYAPQNEQIVERSFTPPTPMPTEQDIWNECERAAREFWERVSADERVSEDFRREAKSNLKKLIALEKYRVVYG